jgi:hypothetical protein
MSKEKYSVIIDDSVDYTITVKEKKNKKSYTFKRSKSDTWLPHAKGETIFKLIDDGNGIDVDIKELEDSYIGYDLFMELTILFNFIRKNESGFQEKYKIIKK